MRIFSLLALIAFLIILPGCTRVELNYQAEAFNRATADSTQKQILLNIVRSSLYEPMIFTKVSGFTGKGYSSGKLGSSLSFNPTKLTSLSLQPSLDINSGISSVTYTDLGTTKPNQKLNQDLTAGEFYALVKASTGHMAMTLFTRRFIVHKSMHHSLMKNYVTKCIKQKSKDHACITIDTFFEKCPSIKKNILLKPDFLKLEKKQQYIVIPNTANNECSYLTFQTLIHLLRLADLIFDVSTTSTSIPKKDSNKHVIKDIFGHPLMAVDKSDSLSFFFQKQKVQSTFKAINKHLKKIEVPTKRSAIFMEHRSPKEFIGFLGALTRLKNDQSFIPKLIDNNGNSIVLFSIERGTPETLNNSNISVAVKGPDNQNYYIKRPRYGEKSRDLTLRSLIFANELINAAVSEKGLPTPSSVIIR